MANYIAEAVGKDVSECDYAYLTGETLREEFGQATFFTATDGNHGRDVYKRQPRRPCSSRR